MHLTSHMYAQQCMHLTRITHVYAFNRDHEQVCMHLTGSHVCAFNRITHVCI